LFKCRAWEHAMETRARTLTKPRTHIVSDYGGTHLLIIAIFTLDIVPIQRSYVDQQPPTEKYWIFTTDLWHCLKWFSLFYSNIQSNVRQTFRDSNFSFQETQNEYKENHFTIKRKVLHLIFVSL
jgi:hypothetical protein